MANDKIASQTNSLMESVIGKIDESQNILIALSSDPSVDELAAAIGLSIYLDGLDKRVTAIYSGATPNALQFLKPEDAFASSADALQDFVVAINKDKADHIRYKVDGDFVKVYITPFRDRIASDDLEFSYGDFNVDLVIALDVANGADLDSALREHGRIMHDASVVNITNGNPGRFGEIELSDINSSSVSEIVAKICYAMADKNPVNAEVATACLTGIVAATNRFANAMTTPDTLSLASRLMMSGANNTLISKNVTSSVDNNLGDETTSVKPVKTSLDNELVDVPEVVEPAKVDEAPVEKPVVSEVPVVPEAPVAKPTNEGDLLADLKNAEASLAMAGAEAIPTEEKETFVINNNEKEVTIEAPADLTKESLKSGFSKYGDMMSEALHEAENPAVSMAPSVDNASTEKLPEMDFAAPSDFSPNPTGAPTIPDMMTMPPDFSAPVVVQPLNGKELNAAINPEPLDANEPKPEVIFENPLSDNGASETAKPMEMEIPSSEESVELASATPAEPAESAEPVPVAPVTPVSEDPSAFKIPGM